MALLLCYPALCSPPQVFGRACSPTLHTRRFRRAAKPGFLPLTRSTLSRVANAPTREGVSPQTDMPALIYLTFSNSEVDRACGLFTDRGTH